MVPVAEAGQVPDLAGGTVVGAQGGQAGGDVIEMADGSTATALAVQWELFSLARKYAEDRGLECMGDPEVADAVLTRWETVLHGWKPIPCRSPASSTGWPS